MQVVREFRVPEGHAPGELDAAGDGELLVALDLRADDSLAEAGLARELVNRVQKLRKKAGLVASDAVEVFIDTAGPAQSGGDLINWVFMQGGENAFYGRLPAGCSWCV